MQLYIVKHTVNNCGMFSYGYSNDEILMLYSRYKCYHKLMFKFGVNLVDTLRLASDLQYVTKST